jgi:FimV-like protein
MAASEPMLEESATSGTSSAQGLMSGQNSSSPMNDEPQKLQPLVVTEGKATSEKKADASQQKDVQVQQQSVATAKSPATSASGAGNVAAMPTSRVEKLPARNTSGIAPIKAAAPAGSNESSGGADTRAHFSRQAADEDNGESNTNEEAGDNDDEIENLDVRARNKATLNTARNHVKNGQKEKAIKLLQSLVEEGNGPEKRQAKRLLKDLED